MRHAFRNTASVIATTAVTALVVFAGVQLGAGSGATGYTTAAATSTGSGTTQTCPRTGCTASSCHATMGLSPEQAYGSSAGSTGNSGSSATAVTSGTTSSSSTTIEEADDEASGSAGTQTCPRTGCTASSCHATQGVSPQQAYGSGTGSTDGSQGGFGGYGHGHGGPGFGG